MSLLGSFSKKPKGCGFLDDDGDSPDAHGHRLLDCTDAQDREIPFRNGDRVRAKLPKQKTHEHGTCMWVGIPSFLPDTGIWVGVELDKPLGTHSGTVSGREYFRCREKHGVMVRIHQVSFETDPMPLEDTFGKQQTEFLSVPEILTHEVTWKDRDGDAFCFYVDDGKMVYTLNGAKRPPFKKLRWSWHKAKGGDPGWIEMPDIGKQFALPREGLPNILGGLRALAKSAGIECEIAEQVEIRRNTDATDCELESVSSVADPTPATAKDTWRDTASESGRSSSSREAPRAASPSTGVGGVVPPVARQTTPSVKRLGSSGVHGVPQRPAAPPPGSVPKMPVTAAGAATTSSTPPTAAPQSMPSMAAQMEAQVASLEALKAEAVRREDYGEAQRLKASIAALRGQMTSAHADPSPAPAAGPGHHRSSGSIDFDDFANMRSSMTAPPVDSGLKASVVQPPAPSNTPVSVPGNGLSQATVPPQGNVSFVGLEGSQQSFSGSPPFPPPANTPTFGQSFAKPTVPDGCTTLQYPPQMAASPQSPVDRPAPPTNTPVGFSPQMSAQWPGQQLTAAQFMSPPMAAGASPPVSAPAAAVPAAAVPVQPAPAGAAPMLDLSEAPIAAPTKHRSQASLDFENFLSGT
eukprot:TRINITY_DN35694_c0_g1_i1.p1 TRINITY_DN35694_c0_g1~~TRINITY_DN35694_c0_g1_i1.p1  ORF type:complete len:634 (+),score=166.54 TRINITY_DN35694_c0_g1_i1:75-1976(+)